MATTGILQAENVIFYHPLDDFVESAVGQTWTGSSGFTVGKIGSSASAATADAFSVGLDNVFATSSLYHTIVGLSATVAVMAYARSGSYYLVVGTVSGTDITWGAEVTLGTVPGGTFNIGMAAMSATTLLVSFRQSDGFGDKGHVHLVTVSGTTATVGPVTRFSDIPRGHEITKLDSTRAVLAYSKFSGPESGQALVATVSGTDITVGAEHEFEPGPLFVRSIGLAALDSSKFLVGWRVTPGAPGNGNLVVGTVSGTDITYGSVVDATALEADFDGVQVTKLTPTTAFVLYSVPAFDMTARIATISGTDITLGPEKQILNSGIGDLANIALSSTEVAIAARTTTEGANQPMVRKLTVSGLDITVGAFTLYDATINADSFAAAALSSSTIVAAHAVGGEGVSAVGALGLEASISAPTPGAYPSAIGHDRVVVAMWAKSLTASGSTVTVERGYSVAMTATTIALGGTTATWSGGGIGTLMTTMNDGSAHLLVLDFENTGGTNWALKTSLDGGAFTSQGAQSSGTQVVATTDTAPSLQIASGASGQWIDELVMWAGNKATFESFATQELANLNDLADTFGEAMNQFEENFGAPLCWQATARMPDGSVWRDSGSGPCPATVRVPRGADDIVVTDGGLRVSPRIVEG
ncbi:MAG: hypothetical protein ACE5E8_10820 [Acidimicrobiia bacterium]